MAVEHTHGEIELATYLTGGLLHLRLLFLPLLPFILPQEEAFITVEVLFLGDKLHPVAGLMKTSVAGVAVEDWIFIVTLSTEADLTVGLKETLHLLEAGAAFGFLLLLQADLLYHGYFQGVF
jgi:hypothetical protein